MLKRKFKLFLIIGLNKLSELLDDLAFKLTVELDDIFTGEKF